MGVMVVCDLCKKPINEKLNDKRTAIHVIHFVELNNPVTWKNATKFDLCPSCRKLVEEFIRNAK